MRAEKSAPFLALLFALAGASCSPPPEAPAAESEAIREGRRIYVSDACPTCHGQDRMGANNGPPLQGLRARWTEEDLIRFLREPSAFRQSDPRLRQLADRYKTVMPGPLRSDEARLRNLAGYLLQD
jgi:mono/diheme cytochrome c family protein